MLRGCNSPFLERPLNTFHGSAFPLPLAGPGGAHLWGHSWGPLSQQPFLLSLVSTEEGGCLLFFPLMEQQDNSESLHHPLYRSDGVVLPAHCANCWLLGEMSNGFCSRSDSFGTSFNHFPTLAIKLSVCLQSVFNLESAQLNSTAPVCLN